MVGDEASVEALARPTTDVDIDTPAQELYQPPPASSALQTKVSWESYTEASSECVHQWWGHLTEDWAELRGHAYLLFHGPGRSEIVRGLEARYPPLMAKVRATLTIAGWDKDLSFVVKVLRVIRRRVFVVLDEVDSVFKRPEQGHVLRELLQLGEDSKDVLVYLAPADTRARVLVTGRLPAAERDQFKSYKYRFVNEGALQCLCEGAEDAAVRQWEATVKRLAVSAAGQVARVPTAD